MEAAVIKTDLRQQTELRGREILRLVAALAYLSIITILFCLSVKGAVAQVAAEPDTIVIHQTNNPPVAAWWALYR